MREKFIDHNFADSSLRMIQVVSGILGEYAADGYNLSLRQLYYQLVARDYIENSQRSYKRLGNLVNNARLAGLVDWSMITDRNRETQALQHWDDPAEIVDAAARSFRVDKWEDQPCHVEVMVEKDALSGVLWPVCARMDVRFTANKGYPSSSLLYEMGKRLARAAMCDNKELYVLHLGDHDPSGIDMTRDLEDRLEMFAGEHIEVNRLALNMDQIEDLQPPKNPAKTTDSRYQAYIVQFGSSSWELDAIEPRQLVDIVTRAIESLRDDEIWGEALRRETEMKAELMEFVERYRGNGQ